jgi:LPXTG-motif cell wall-anchored protein
MRKIASVLIAGGAILLMGAGAAQAASTTVETVEFKFNPASVSIDPGDSITFDNTGSEAHTATADNGSFDTGNLDPGDSKTITIKAPGTYSYYCKYHGGPGGTGMSGTITVGKGGPVAGGGGGGEQTPATATPLPLIAAVGAALLVLGLVLGRRRRAATR